jgi:arabinofuranosyltransferase
MTQSITTYSSRYQRIISLAAYILLLLAVLIFLWELRNPLIQADDAFISYRYAHNFLNGHGLVFNTGEYVEGFTNLLWVLLIALGLKINVSAPIFGHWLCVFSGLLLMTATYLYTAALLPRSARSLAAFAPMLLLVFNTFVKWTSSGLEQGLFAALILLALYAYTLKRLWLVCLFCVLAALTRPEGLLYATVLLNTPWCIKLIGYRRNAWKQSMSLLMPALCFGIAILSLTLFRYFYYGDVVPNTFHAKVGGIPLEWGIFYIYKFLVDGPGFLLFGTIFAAVLVPKFRTGFALIILTIAYVLWVRGDVFRLGRFFLPVLPVMVTGSLLAVYAWHKKNILISSGLVLMPILAIMFSLYMQIPVDMPSMPAATLPSREFIYDDFNYNSLPARKFPYSAKRANSFIHEYFYFKGLFKKQLQYIRQADPPINIVAAVGIGRLAFYGQDLLILDLVGLTNKTIAKSTKKISQKTLLLPGHQRTDADYIFNRKPDLIFIPPKKNNGIVTLPAIQDLWNSPRLTNEYFWDDRIGGYRRKTGREG